MLKKLAILIAVFLVVGLAGCRRDRMEITLSAAATQPAYAADETVEVELVLENTGTLAASVSELLAGTVEVRALTKDGARVLTRVTTVDYYEGLGTLLVRGLRVLRPGESTTLTWTGRMDNVLGGQALPERPYFPAAEQLLVSYLISDPGEYSVSVRYQYSGPNGGRSDVYLQPTNEATATFRVTP